MDENHREWDIEVIQDIFNDRDGRLIQQIPIPIRSRKDAWFWLMDDKGVFTVKNCYRRLQGENECPDTSFWKKLWDLKLPGKVVNFLWRICRDCLPTAAALVAKHVMIYIACPWCYEYYEDTLHVLFHCSFIQEVWNVVGLQDLIIVLPNDSVLEVLQKVFRKGTMEQCVLVGLFCWSLWNRRNKWVWEHVNMSVFGVKAKSFNLLADWRRAKEEESKQKMQHQPGTRSWRKPPTGWVKINIDAACDQLTGTVGLGCVIRDEQGCFLRACSNVVRHMMQPREADALSLKEALSWTKQWRNNRCIFESDAKLLVDAVNENGGQSYFDAIVEDCKELLKHFNEVLVVFVYRSANTVAHLVARAVCFMSGHQEWCSTAPEIIAFNIASESF